MIQHCDIHRTQYLSPLCCISGAHTVFANQKHTHSNSEHTHSNSQHTHSNSASMQKSKMNSGTGCIIVFLACDPETQHIILDHDDLCCSPLGRCKLYVDVITARQPRHRRSLVCTRAPPGPPGTQASCSVTLTLRTNHFECCEGQKSRKIVQF